MKRQNYGFEKRQKDIKKQQKREEKHLKRRLKEEPLDAALQIELDALCEEGRDIWSRFRSENGSQDFHPFIAADYALVLKTLLPHRGAGLSFLEWGSASGVITIMADLLGFEAFGIELDPELVGTARTLARAHESGAQFASGSFLPEGYQWRPSDGDGRTGTLGSGPSGYPELGHTLDYFDLVFAYPWGGEEPLMIDLMKNHGRSDATLLLNTVAGTVVTYQDGGLR